MNIDSMIQGNPQALVTSYNGVLVADSLEVADRFGKRHTHVLRSIDDIINQLESQSTQNWADYFIPDDYQDNKNRTQRRFKLTRDGFSLLVMGFTGPAALHWKLLYIEAFNKMEQALRSNVDIRQLVTQITTDVADTPFRDELKTDLSRRSLMITEEMVLLLIFWRLIQNTEKRKAAERGIEYNPDNLVFCTRKGTYIYPRNFTKMWSENLRSMGIDHKRFHDLRHTVATVMLEDGEAMNTVQEQLGHYDAGFTASRYGHVTAKMRNSAAVKLGERLEKVRNPEAEDAEDANSVKNEDTVIPFQEGRKLKSAACKIK